ncbi:hypothetical protein BDQ17DRAFT_1065606 [Cyathus striatus]|nr:hypothetical protein BDQ17DRAFT_1065606 [Cyathus striatus]
MFSSLPSPVFSRRFSSYSRLVVPSSSSNLSKYVNYNIHFSGTYTETYPGHQTDSNIQVSLGNVVISSPSSFNNFNPELSNPWYIIAAVAYSASNRPEGVSFIFNYVWQRMNVRNESVENQRLLAKKLREAIFRSRIFSGYSKAINSLAALNEVMAEDFHESGPLRSIMFLLSCTYLSINLLGTSTYPLSITIRLELTCST